MRCCSWLHCRTTVKGVLKNSLLHGVDAPLARDALERVRAAVAERDVGAHDEVLRGPRHQHLARAGERERPGPEVPGEAAHVAPDHLALAGVEPAPQLEAEPVRDRLAARL